MFSKFRSQSPSGTNKQKIWPAKSLHYFILIRILKNWNKYALMDWLTVVLAVATMSDVFTLLNFHGRESYGGGNLSTSIILILMTLLNWTPHQHDQPCYNTDIDHRYHCFPYTVSQTYLELWYQLIKVVVVVFFQVGVWVNPYQQAISNGVVIW